MYEQSHIELPKSEYRLIRARKEAHKKVCLARWHMLNWPKDAIDEMNTLPVPEKYVAGEGFSVFCINGSAFGESRRNLSF